MQWITYKRGMFVQFVAVQSDSHLSSECASDAEVDFAAAGLKRQIDIAARSMKIALQGHPPTFEDQDV